MIAEGNASNMRFGVIVAREFEEHSEIHLPMLVDNLTRMGCQGDNILIKYVPTMHDILVTTQFMAQYTDVDGVIILAPKDIVMGSNYLMQSIALVQVQNGMVVEIGGAECAADIVYMIEMQNDMELSAPAEKMPPFMLS